MAARPSSTLRALWVVGGGLAAGVAGGSWARSFFQAIVADGFVQCVREHVEFLADVGHFDSFIKQGLGLGEEFGGEFVALTRWGRAEKRGGPFEAEFCAGPF